MSINAMCYVTLPLKYVIKRLAVFLWSYLNPFHVFGKDIKSRSLVAGLH